MFIPTKGDVQAEAGTILVPFLRKLAVKLRHGTDGILNLIEKLDKFVVSNPSLAKRFLASEEYEHLQFIRAFAQRENRVYKAILQEAIALDKQKAKWPKPEDMRRKVPQEHADEHLKNQAEEAAAKTKEERLRLMRELFDYTPGDPKNLEEVPQTLEDLWKKIG